MHFLSVEFCPVRRVSHKGTKSLRAADLTKQQLRVFVTLCEPDTLVAANGRAKPLCEIRVQHETRDHRQSRTLADCAHALSQNVPDNATVNVREAEVAAGVAIRQLLVVEPKQV